MEKNLLRYAFICLIMVCGMGLAGQEPEEYTLWPQGPKEKNGITAGETRNERGSVSNVSNAMLYVYRPAQSNGMAVVICPGGGYTHLSMMNEGELFARWLNAQGITAVVLKYRMPNKHYNIPLADASRAMKFVRSMAEEWRVKPDKIGVAGFSAGGHLASTLATRFDLGSPNTKDRLERFSSRPDFLILFYPVVSMATGLTHQGSREALLGKNPQASLIERYSNDRHVTPQTPPAFLVHSDNDTAVPAMNSVIFYQALKKNKVPAVMYIFNEGGHGWGLKEDFLYYREWTGLLEKWLDKQK